MDHVTAFLCAFVRLFRPTNGTHTSPLGYLRELVSETSALRRRSSRVRRYVSDASTVAELPASSPIVPAPRKPLDDRPRTALSAAVPVVDAREAQAPAALVRGYYVAWERREALRRADANRLGVAVLWGISAAQEEVSA